MSAMDTDFVEEEVVENPTLKAAYNLAPLHHNQPLIWDYEVELIGEKIYDKVIHLCEICELPILVYGRMLPCKHVFCFDCARKCEKICKRCGLKVQKVEKSALGTVYVCTHGAPKHSTNGCRRTYLSQRDLQSHIYHRHVPKPSSEAKNQASTAVAQTAAPQLPLTQQQAALQQAAEASAQPPTSAAPPLSIQPQVPPVLLPNVTGPAPPPLGGQQPHPASLNPPQAIPGLGDLQSRPSGSPVVGQASPALPPDLNPNPMGLGMNFNLQSQLPLDQAMYNPMEMTPMAHQQQQQQQLQQPSMMGMPASPMLGMAKSKSMQRFGEPSSMLPSNNMMQSLASSQLPGVGQLSPSVHMTAQMHQHQQQQKLLQEQQHQQQQHRQEQQLLREQQLLQERQQHMGLQHQDSLSKMPPNMMPSPHARPPQGQSNMDSFASSPNSYETMHSGQGRTNNINLITVPIQDESHYQPMSMVGQSQSNHLPFSPSRPMLSQNFSQSETTQGMQQPGFPHVGGKPTQPQGRGGGGISSTQPMPFSQSSGNNMRMNNSMMINPRTGLNNMQASALVEMFQALARPKGGPGLMSLPGANNPGMMSPRFNQSNWSPGNPRTIQPRMSQNQPRPRGDSQFKHNYF